MGMSDIQSFDLILTASVNRDSGAVNLSGGPEEVCLCPWKSGMSPLRVADLVFLRHLQMSCSNEAN